MYSVKSRYRGGGGGGLLRNPCHRGSLCGRYSMIFCLSNKKTEEEEDFLRKNLPSRHPAVCSRPLLKTLKHILKSQCREHLENTFYMNTQLGENTHTFSKVSALVYLLSKDTVCLEFFSSFFWKKKDLDAHVLKPVRKLHVMTKQQVQTTKRKKFKKKFSKVSSIFTIKSPSIFSTMFTS